MVLHDLREIKVVVSHIQRIGCQPEKKLLYTVAKKCMRSIKSQHVPGRKDTASKNKCNSGLQSSSFDARHPGAESPPFFFRAELLGISRIDRTVFYEYTRSD